MIVISRNLVLAEGDESSADNGVILWDNLVTVSNIAATSEDVSHPAINVANPATHLYWKGGVNAGNEYFKITTNYLEEIDGLGIARHNFGSANIVTSIDGATVFEQYQKVLLHFDGANGSTSILDDNAGGSAHVWTANGNAQISTATSVFGGSSLFCDGVGDYVSMPDHADIALGSGPFTVECRIGPNGGAGTQMNICGQCDNGASVASTSFFIIRTAGNIIWARACVGAVAFDVFSTSAITSGFHHVRFVRTGNILKLFIDGVQEGGDVAITGTVNNSSNVLSVGRLGEATGSTWNGWIDEFAMFVGEAKSGAVPVVPYDDWVWFEIFEERQLADDTPVLFRFEPQILGAVRLVMQPGDEPPEIGVMYLHKLLVLERSIKIDADHTPITMGRTTKVINGRSESGNFLGRILINEFRESGADFDHFTPDWYRANFDPFIVASKQVPFFYAWDPIRWPLEVGYVWMMGDPQPVTHPSTGRVGIALKYQGIV